MANLNFGLRSVKSNTKVVQLVKLGNGVVQITMNDEENSNGFSQELMAGLFQCFHAVSQNKTYKVVILAGTTHYFATGATQEQLMLSSRGESKFTTENAFALLTLALNCPIPVIAAMEGHALGGGFVLGLYADFLVLSRESFYSNSILKYDFIPVAGAGAGFILLKKLGSELGQEMIYTARKYRGEELAKRSVPFPVLPRKEVLNFAKKIANEIAKKTRLSLVTLKEYLTSEIRDKFPELIRKGIQMHEITVHQSEVKTRIELNFAVGNNQESSRHKHSQLREAENILSQLQSGDVSLENGSKLLLGITGKEVQEKAVEKKIDKDRNKLINTDNSEKILSLLSAGEISLENAENLLLEVVESDPKTETNGLTLVQNQKQISQQEEVLHQLQSDVVSLDNGSKLLLGLDKIYGKISLINKSINKSKVKTHKNEKLDLLEYKQYDDKPPGGQKNESENILEQLKLGNISVDNAENMLLGIHKNNQELNEQEYILSDLRSGKISVNDAESLLVRIHHNRIKSEDNSKKIAEKPIKNCLAYHPPKLNARLRLFCFHGVGGSRVWFQNWSKNWQSDIEVCPVELPGRKTHSKEQPFTEFLPLIKTLGEVIGQKVDSPFAFYGHSMGALICFELAHLLQQEYYLSPIHLFISGCWSPNHIQDMYSKNLNHSNNLDLNSLVKTFDISPSIVKEGSLLQGIIPVFETDLKLLHSYFYNTKELLNCPISVFGGTEDPIVSKKDILEWCHHTTSTFKLQMLPGKHMFIQDSQNQKLLLEAIAQDLTISLNQMS